jgi:sugar lactone lactonase YvrE
VVYFLGNNLRWNQTGVIAAGTTNGGNANQLNQPSCLYIDANDTLYICDYNNNRIQKWVQGATSGVTVAGDSTGAHGSTSILFDKPIDLTFDNSGYMYVVDYNNNRVQRFPPNSTSSTSGVTVAGTTGNTNALTDLKQPTAIDIDNNSNLYILDQGNKRVVRWAPNATSGVLLISSNIINNDFGLLLVPDSLNQIYMTDQGSNDLYLWTFNVSSPDSIITAVNSTDNVLNNPMGIALDPYGNVYVADFGKNRVVMYCNNSTAGIVVAIDNSGPNSLQHPMAVAFDSNLNLYVVTKDNGQVMKLSRL